MKNQGEHEFLSSLIDAETLYHNAPCGYFSMLSNGMIIKVNQTFTEWTGFPALYMVDKMNITDLFSNGGKLYYHMFYAPLLQLQDKVNEISFDIFRKDGTSFPALLNANTVKDATGRMVAINVAVTDISDRKKYETELLNAKALAEAEKNKFETVAAHIPEMIWTASRNGKINYVNKRFADYFELSDLKFENNRISGLIHPADAAQARRSWVAAIRQGEDFTLQIRLSNRLHQYNWYLFKGTPFRNSAGEIEKWLGSCLNIHDHVQELERRDEFISVASHELKTPITSLNLTLQLLGIRSNGFTDKQFKLIEQASRNAKKINTLIDDLLNVKRLTEGQLALNLQRVNVRRMIQECIDAIFADTSPDITVSADDSLEIFADEHRIGQVLTNFINNAVKYSPLSPIRVDAQPTEAKIKISVADQGPGIASDKLPRLFERYYRADHSGKEYSGLGLGLYISAEIISRHGGKIGVDSEPGKGSVFWFTI